MRTLSVAAVRLVAREAATVDAWWHDVETAVRHAAGSGARLVCLPEYVCLGLVGTVDRALFAGDERELYTAAFAPHRDTFAERGAALAARLGIWLLGGSFWSGPNEAFLFGPAGELLVQRKLHPVPAEVACGMEPGDRLETIAVDGVVTGIATCFDIEFPEVARALVGLGAELILSPSHTSTPQGVGRVAACARARAVEGQCFVAVIPINGSVGIGTANPSTGFGDPMIYGPIDPLFPAADGVIAGAPLGAPFAYAELDVERLRAARAADGPMPILELRRPELYPLLGGVPA